MVDTPSIRPLGGPQAPGRYDGRYDPPERRGAAPSELPAGRGIDPAAGDAAVTAEAPRRAPDPRAAEPRGRAAIESHFALDRETRDLVYRAVDPASGAVLLQSPDEATLRLRAYRIAAEADAARRAVREVRQEA